jgi:hypothetical protein
MRGTKMQLLMFSENLFKIQIITYSTSFFALYMMIFSIIIIIIQCTIII